VTYGCIATGDEWVSQWPYNAAVRILTACLRPMPGAYRGPYPTEKEAAAALRNAPTVARGYLVRDQVVVDGATIQLDEGVGRTLLERIRRFETNSDTDVQTIQAQIWQEECLILRIPKDSYATDETTSAAIVLLSRSTGRPFAYYAEGNYSHHFPPVTWKKR
jgi:hypothetical protein